MNNSLVDFNEDNYIFFSIETYGYAFKSNYVLSVMQLVELENPGFMPDFVLGLIEYNNQMIKIIDLRKILNLEAKEYGISSNIIIIKTPNDIFGVVAENVSEIRKIKTGKFNVPTKKMDGDYIEGIYTDKDSSSALINLEMVENFINSPASRNYSSMKPITNYLPQDIQSKEILHRRKLHYTRKMREVSNVLIESQDTYIKFNLKKNICCIKILHVIGFYKYSNVKLIEIPCTPDFIAGIISVKGRYVTVIDLLKFTEGKSTEITSDSNIIVVEYEDYQIGIITGAIGETIDIDENIIKASFNNSKSCLVECVIKDSMYLFFDIKKLFSDEKLYIS